MDGKPESVTGYENPLRLLIAHGASDALPQKLPPDDLYVPNAESGRPLEPPEVKHPVLCGQTLSAFPQYKRLRFLKRPASVRLCGSYGRKCDAASELCAACWREMHVRDACHVQTRAMIHVCGPSCWK